MEKNESKRSLLLGEVIMELKRAETKFPGFPQDPIHGSAVLAEECGELQQACLQYTYEKGNFDNVKKEAVHTAAMALRFLFNLDKIQPNKSEWA